MHRKVLKKCIVAFLIATQTLSPALAGDPPIRIARWLPWASRDVGKPPKTSQDATIEELAKNIDWLENRINLFGTVVAKSPDVWGEARLTAHRQEFEEVLKNELRNFSKDQINGAEFVSDQSFLAFALALKGPTTTTTSSGETRVPPPSVSINATTTTANSQPAEAGNAAVSLNTNFTGTGQLFGTTSNGQNILSTASIQVEQTEMLDQLARYVNHLHSIRRINEGDDTSDSPGYSMNLVRIPVSLFPGQHTKLGHGAEITVTAEPYHGPGLLPMAYRDFVINDLVDQLSLPLAAFLNADPKNTKEMIELFESYRDSPDKFGRINAEMKRTGFPPGVYEALQRSCQTTLPTVRPGPFFKSDLKWNQKPLFAADLIAFKGNLESIICDLKSGAESKSEKATEIRRRLDQLNVVGELDLDMSSEALEAVLARQSVQFSELGLPHELAADPNVRSSFDARVQKLQKERGDMEVSLDKQVTLTNQSKEIASAVNKELEPIINGLSETSKALEGIQRLGEKLSQLPMINLPSGTTRRSTLPFPPTQLICNYGLTELAYVATSAYRAFKADVINREVVHVTDLQAFLRKELGAAYELMNSDVMQHWWEEARFGQVSLVQDLRMRNTAALAETRQCFISEITTANSDQSCRRDQTTATLAWCIYVESLLLNERLVQDIRETLGNKPNTLNCEQWLPYFGPNPPEEARMMFNEYVKIRWPIRVFALDPHINEQNIADVRSIYRQMQMAVALSFASGNVGMSAAMQSMRKLQRDRATFDLNRTAIGFGHGDDTFGWRFYPRFQTPPVEGNATVFFRDLIVGGPTDRQLERSREIEPGMRECTAIVLMPSFVPHVTFTTRSNWFKLDKPGVTADSMEDTVAYSRAIKQMETNANECVKCAHLYRDGEVDRLIKRVHQLDQKLPLQTLECQVPLENTAGGFEIFSGGTRELAPELNGWYGAPGYDPTRNCRLFLAGDNFSVPQSRLIVGNQEITFRLLSRQVMEVTLPAGLASVRDRNLDTAEVEHYSGYLDAHIATPYGVSGHLLIPVLRESTRAVAVPTLVSNAIRIQAVRKAASGIEISSFKISPGLNFLELDVPPNVGLDVVSTRKIRFVTSSGRDQLANVDDVTISRVDNSTRFMLNANDFSQQFDSPAIGTISSKLGSALKDHIEYQLRHDKSLGSVNYRVSVVLLAGTKDAPTILANVDGELGIDVEIINP